MEELISHTPLVAQLVNWITYAMNSAMCNEMAVLIRLSLSKKL